MPSDPQVARPQPARGVMAMRSVTNVQVAAATGYSRGYVSRVLGGYWLPSVEFAAKLAAYLGVPESKLLRPERTPVPPPHRRRKPPLRIVR